ncbi:hypothetical protein AVEN_195566-1, partial [Araneus ventricosus]
MSRFCGLDTREHATYVAHGKNMVFQMYACPFECLALSLPFEIG